LPVANATVADVICDRLVHNAYRITLKGESMRKTKIRLTQKIEFENLKKPTSLRSDKTRPHCSETGGRLPPESVAGITGIRK
jgi:hypothetical protein